jgi:DNA-directed RNA polymerase subunit RPC12/RpoP
MTQDRGGPEGVLVQVCIQCGREYMFEGEEPAADMTCGKCGGVVFRSFFAETRKDEALTDFRESTERDTLTTDGPTDVAPGDLHDLGSG